MGFEITETESLTFPAFPGLEVVVKTATTFGEFQALEAIARDGSADDRDAALANFAATFIESWNLTSGGEPLPVERFPRIPLPMKLEILNRWMGLMRGPSAPLGQESSNGRDSPAQPTDEPENE